MSCTQEICSHARARHATNLMFVCASVISVHNKDCITARWRACSPAKVMTGNRSYSGIRGFSHAALCRRRTDLTLRIVNPATPPFEQRLVRTRRVKCARNSSKDSISADAQDLPQVRTLCRPVSAPDRSALCGSILCISRSPTSEFMHTVRTNHPVPDLTRE